MIDLSITVTITPTAVVEEKTVAMVTTALNKIQMYTMTNFDVLSLCSILNNEFTTLPEEFIYLFIFYMNIFFYLKAKL